MSFIAKFANSANVDNPFLWKPEEQLEVIPNDMIGRLSLKIEEKSLEQETEFESIILHLVLSYEHFLKSNVEKSLGILRNMSDQIVALGVDEKAESDVRKWLAALRHLLQAATLHVLLYIKKIEDAKKTFEEMNFISCLDTKNRASLWGLRASFFAEYGILGSKAGIQYAAKANEMDPEESLWFFLQGKLLGRVRRVEKPFDIPAPNELEALETALSKESIAAYTIYAAQVYRETANRAFKKHKHDERLFPNLKQIIDEMNAKSSELYRKSLALKPFCSQVKFRCAKGFMSLPPPFKDINLAKSCIVEGLKMSPTSAYGNHVMAMYYERCEKDFRSAITYLKICVPVRVFGACIDLLRLEFWHCGLSRSDVKLRLNKLYEEFVEPPRQCQTLSQLTSFHLFLEYDLESAAEYLVRALRLNSTCDDIHNHRSLFLNLHHTISLLEVVVDEAKIALYDKKCAAKTRSVCNKLFSDLTDLNAAYRRNRPRYLRQALLKKSESFRGGGAAAKTNVRLTTATTSCDSFRARPSTTMSYLQRRKQHLAADATLKKIDEFTNAWKKELTAKCAAGCRPNDDKSESEPCGSRAQAAASTDDERVGQPAKIRYQSEQQSSQRSRNDEALPSSAECTEQLQSLADLTICSGSKDDSDFEKSVLAYRLAKRASNAAAAPSSGHENAAESGNGRAANSSSRLTSVRCEKVSVKRRDNFDRYLARSTAELERKFEPDDIVF